MDVSLFWIVWPSCGRAHSPSYPGNPQGTAYPNTDSERSCSPADRTALAAAAWRFLYSGLPFKQGGHLGSVPPMTTRGSITQWLGLLQAGEPAAAEKLWQCYFDRLVRLASRKLRASRRRAADEEDVVLSAFD